MSRELQSASAEQTERMGALLAPLLEPGDVLALTGDLGAGKTRLVKGVARGLGIAEPVTSPTFNLLLVHHGRLTLYHLDLYRLEDPRQLEDIDFRGTLEAEGVSVIEWGDRFPEALPDDVLRVDVLITGDETREIGLTPTGPRSRRVADAWATACGGESQ